MAKTGIVLVLCLIVGMAACGELEGDGGVAVKDKIVGATSVLSGTRNLYSVESTRGISAYKWSVVGNGTIIGKADASELLVGTPADAGVSTFTVRVSILIHGLWRKVDDLVVQIVDGPRFKVVLNTPNNLTPASLTGSGTITMTSNDASAASWSLYFVGDTSGLPQMVPVTVQTTNGAFTLQNIWLTAAKETKTLLFPKAGGGSVGIGGTVLNTGASRPALTVGGPAESATVRITAAGARTMVITVKYQ